MEEKCEFCDQLIPVEHAVHAFNKAFCTHRHAGMWHTINERKTNEQREQHRVNLLQQNMQAKATFDTNDQVRR